MGTTCSYHRVLYLRSLFTHFSSLLLSVTASTKIWKPLTAPSKRLRLSWTTYRLDTDVALRGGNGPRFASISFWFLSLASSHSFLSHFLPPIRLPHPYFSGKYTIPSLILALMTVCGIKFGSRLTRLRSGASASED